MQQGGADRLVVHAQLGQDRGDGERVGDVRVAALAGLAAVHLRGHLVGALDQPHVGLRMSPADGLDQGLEHRVNAATTLGAEPRQAAPNARAGRRPVPHAAACWLAVPRGRLPPLHPAADPGRRSWLSFSRISFSRISLSRISLGHVGLGRGGLGNICCVRLSDFRLGIGGLGWRAWAHGISRGHPVIRRGRYCFLFRQFLLPSGCLGDARSGLLGRRNVTGHMRSSRLPRNPVYRWTILEVPGSVRRPVMPAAATELPRHPAGPGRSGTRAPAAPIRQPPAPRCAGPARRWHWRCRRWPGRHRR